MRVPVHIHFDENALAVLLLGAGLLVAELSPVSSSGEKIATIIASGMVGYLARGGVGMAKRFLSPDADAPSQ